MFSVFWRYGANGLQAPSLNGGILRKPIAVLDDENGDSAGDRIRAVLLF